MRIAIIGNGGHSKVVSDLISNLKNDSVVGFFDDQYHTEQIFKEVFYGPIDSVIHYAAAYPDVKYIIAIGNNQIRKRVERRIHLPIDKYATVIHPSAVVSKSATIGFGTVVLARAVINAEANIGNHVIINTCAVVEHESEVANYVHLSPNVTLTGGVKVQEGTHVGAGATVIPNIEIGAWTMIGAGATVIDHIPDHCTAVGVPAKIKVKELYGGE